MKADPRSSFISDAQLDLSDKRPDLDDKGGEMILAPRSLTRLPSNIATDILRPQDAVRFVRRYRRAESRCMRDLHHSIDSVDAALVAAKNVRESR